MQQDLKLDFVLSFCREMIPGHGEDSYCHSFCDSAGMMGVFDGCGGAGARTHDHYSGHTEAYMASRLCAGAFYDLFRQSFPCDADPRVLAQEVFYPAAVERLKQFQPPQDPDAFVIKGSMVRTLPTTAAVALVQSSGKQSAKISAMWAGDSRVYLLDKNGLAQLTTDDTSVPDPMENVYEDGVLRNIFCSDRNVTLHCKTVEAAYPFAVLTATDGCFGYVSTPMEFEGLLLHTLAQAQTPAQWEEALAQAIGAVAGDDHAMCLAAFGYQVFSALQSDLAERGVYLETQFLEPVRKLPLENRESRFVLWQQYRDNYFRHNQNGAD